MLNKKPTIAGLIIFFLFGIALTAEAATVTWTGTGVTGNASNPSNWSGNTAPQYGDDVVFDSTSKNCTWDYDVTLNSLTNSSSYTGKITKISSVTLTIKKEIVWTGAVNSSASNPANWLGGNLPQNGSGIIFNNTSARDCAWDINITPSIFTIDASYDGNITLYKPLNISGNLLIYGGALDLNNQNLNIDGYIIIGAGGSLIATSSTITLAGDWLNAGLFSAGTSTLILNGASQTIYGNNTFYNLQKTVTTPSTLYFHAGYTQTIENTITLNGAPNNLLTLASTTAGQQWKIDPQGTRNISYVNIRDSRNINFANIVALNSADIGNNSGISFGGIECGGQ